LLLTGRLLLGHGRADDLIAALRAHSAHVAGQVVAALPTMAGRDAATITPEQNGQAQPGKNRWYPQRCDDCDDWAVSCGIADSFHLWTPEYWLLRPSCEEPLGLECGGVTPPDLQPSSVHKDPPRVPQPPRFNAKNSACDPGSRGDKKASKNRPLECPPSSLQPRHVRSLPPRQRLSNPLAVERCERGMRKDFITKARKSENTKEDRRAVVRRVWFEPVGSVSCLHAFVFS
jgi:hypothetical protein